jgi:hypothetical protein
MTRVVALLATVAAALAVAQTGGGASSPWPALHRSLHLPALLPGRQCPVSPVARGKFAKYGVGAGIGPGPAYPIGFGQPGSTLSFQSPPGPTSPFFGSAWSGQKILWFVLPSYRGPVLVRGRRLDGPGVLRFQNGKVPPAELRITRTTYAGYPSGVQFYGQRYLPSYTRLRTAGCYGYQIDGTSFSRVIVFRAEQD